MGTALLFDRNHVDEVEDWATNLHVTAFAPSRQDGRTGTGMNFKVGLFEEPAYFWVVVGGIVVLAAATLVAARARRWI